MWEKTPIRTMEDNYTIGTRKKITHNPDKTNDIIARHMWPVGGTKPPNSLEGAVVSMADKIATVVDFAKGCQQKRLGLKDTIQDKILREKG